MIRRLVVWVESRFHPMWMTWIGHLSWTFVAGLIGWPFGLAVIFSGCQFWAFAYREVEAIFYDWLHDRPTYWLDAALDTAGPALAFTAWVLLT